MSDTSTYILDEFFADGVMSVHIVTDQQIVSKQGKPGGWEMVTSDISLDKKDMERLIAQLHAEIESSDDAFVEIDRTHSQVLQIGPYRVVVVHPPLTKRLEITAVRPVTSRTLAQYELEDKIQTRLLNDARGVLITGAPGEGKSTFATAFVNELAKTDQVIKTIESPRDLQVADNITQYSFSHAPHNEIRDILLLSRPDIAIYDEVRNTDDFLLFKDLRLTGIGLIGVMHATKAIDGVQRMLGKIEMGLIPQVIDTIIFIQGGAIAQLYTLEQTVKTPIGMNSADLARPVVLIKDLLTDETKYEMYSYGDSVVVMPTDQVGEYAMQSNAIARFAKYGLQEHLSNERGCQCIVEVEGLNRIIVYVPTHMKPKIIGKSGTRIQQIEKDLGVSIGVKDLNEVGDRGTDNKGRTKRGGGGGGGGGEGGIDREVNEVKKGKKTVIQIKFPRDYAHSEITCMVGGKLMTFVANHNAIVQIRRMKLIQQIQDGEFAVVS